MQIELELFDLITTAKIALTSILLAFALGQHGVDVVPAGLGLGHHHVDVVTGEGRSDLFQQRGNDRQAAGHARCWL